MAVAPDMPLLNADPLRLKQILINLLSNAIKFTDRGGRVTVSATNDSAHVAVTVQDTGIGIAAEDLSRLGDPFFQARDAYNRPYDGTGLGLSIVKGLVNLHGGTLAIESEVGVGTAVTIRLPIDCEQPQPLPAAEPAAIPLIPRLPAASLLPASGANENQGKKRAYS
jgi:cell cycle sensor histidine kinase DivJ